MLKQLYIQNFALIEQLELDLCGQMTVFTGETGAGKSIVLGAIGLVLGDRAQATMVRAGSEKATVTAIFEATPDLAALLDEKGLTQDDECIIRRQIDSAGRSRAFVNDTPVPNQVLQDIGERLINIHGQHAHRTLLERDSQRETLDVFAAHADLKQNAATHYRDWKRISDSLGKLNAMQDQPGEEELLRYQIEELTALKLTPDLLEELQQEYRRLSNLSKILDSSQHILNTLDDDGTGATVLLSRAGRELDALADFDPLFDNLSSLLSDAAIPLQEAITTLRRYIDTQDADPDHLLEIENRITALHDLARKHRCRIEDLPTVLEELKARRSDFENSAQRRGELERQQAALLAEYRSAADRLHRSRAAAAERLSARITGAIRGLGMPGSEFVIKVNYEPDALPALHGGDRIEFLVSTNPGQPLRPLDKVASGGELARMSLAIKAITAADQGVPTLIFDEVDTGVGGAVAEIVGQHLRILAERHQVFCVTHLPQVAAQGQHHFQVSKTVRDNTTSIAVTPLARDTRILEIARMLGGVKISEQTLSHAEEMLGQVSV